MANSSNDVMWSIRNGDLDMLKDIGGKADFDANMTTSQSTLLVSASDYGHVEIIEFLINKGADVNKAAANGITPLLAAIWEEHSDAVKVLLKHGANKNLKSPNGNSYQNEAPNDEIKQLLK